jgi:multiple sugar transport system permease protein
MNKEPMKNIMRRINARLYYANIAVYLVLILISYQFLYPMLRMITTALMSAEDIINPAVNWIPRTWAFGNIRIAAAVLDVKKTLFNSLWYSGLLAACQTLVSSMTGFAFARYDFKFKNFWFMMVIVSFILPAPVMLISRTMLFVGIQESTGMNMIGTPIPQVSMAIFGQGVYSAILILIFYNFIRMIPRALDEAATIDGASAGQIFYHIILKMSLTTILIVFLFSFVWNWNETFITATFLRDKIPLLPSRLNMFDSIFASYSSAGRGSAQSRLNEAYKMSATFLSILPLFIIYLLVQRQFIKGIESAGITGE